MNDTDQKLDHNTDQNFGLKLDFSSFAPTVLSFFNRENRRQTGVFSIVFLAGAIFGLVILGWWLWPVEYGGATMIDVNQSEQEMVIGAYADLYSYQNNAPRAAGEAGYWHGDSIACRLAMNTDDVYARIRFEAFAYAINGRGCIGVDVSIGIDGAGE